MPAVGGVNELAPPQGKQPVLAHQTSHAVAPDVQPLASYRDTLVLLLRFAEKQLGKLPNSMQITDITAKFLANFLEHLKGDRNNSARIRNIRLAAVRSFLKFAARRDLDHLGIIEQALAVPMKRFERKLMGFLPREQMLTVIDVATDTWVGQRDRLLLTLMFNTGARVSEIIGVRAADLVLDLTSSIRLHGNRLSSIPKHCTQMQDGFAGRLSCLPEAVPTVR
jgi:site-specific recombinase XerD